MNKTKIYNSILAGLCISLGGLAFLKLTGIIGAVMFTFGLLSIVAYRYPLYTGTAGFFTSCNEFFNVLCILLFNIVGCVLTAWAVSTACPDIAEQVSTVVEHRVMLTWPQVLLLATGCGYIMTTVVQHARENGNYRPLIYGIPLFIMCGMLHSIADAFYYSLFIINNISNIDIHYIYQILGIYVIEVIGNFIGCNIYRFIK